MIGVGNAPTLHTVLSLLRSYRIVVITAIAVLLVWAIGSVVSVGAKGAFTAKISLQRPQRITATLQCRYSAGMRQDTAPAGVAGDHEGFEARDGACHDAVIELNLHPDARQSTVEGWIRSPEFGTEMVDSENGEGDRARAGVQTGKWGQDGQMMDAPLTATGMQMPKRQRL